MTAPSAYTDRTGRYIVRASNLKCPHCGRPFRAGYEPRDGDPLCLDCRADLAATMLPLVFDDEAPP